MRDIKFEAPTQPPRMKLIHGVEVPDISFEPKRGDYFYRPCLSTTALCECDIWVGGGYQDIFKARDMCYPETLEGEKAAILHTKAMLGIKE